MLTTSRRDALLLAMSGTAIASLPSAAHAAKAGRCQPVAERFARGVDGQRKADLGKGTYLNPVIGGDQADPSVLRDGDTWYKVSSSFYDYPGLVIWKSQDLVNWAPVGPALHKPIGSVYAPDLIKHQGRFYIYFPAANLDLIPEAMKGLPTKRPILANYVVHADSISGPWSDPVDLKIYEGIDPGHVVGEDGKRYLFINEGRIVPLTDDGLARNGETRKVYDGWPIPKDWVVEGFALESPKLLKKDGWFYMFSAQGGTAGPPTSHMVVVARSRSVNGPWEDCPHNPIVRTADASEPWWSRGHATPVQGPAGDWWLVYHAYENGYRTLGRAMLLEPFEWTAEGWPRALGKDLSRPLQKPRGGQAVETGKQLSGPFDSARFGTVFHLFKPEDNYDGRIAFDNGSLVLSTQGDKPGNSSPVVFGVGDHSYEATVTLELEGDAEGGLLLFYDEKFCCGLGADGKVVRAYKMGESPGYITPAPAPRRRLHMRVVNRQNVASFYESSDGTDWTLQSSFEVSGYNHNVADGFLSLRVALFASRQGKVRFRDFIYRALV